jgi:hypothetical protein
MNLMKSIKEFAIEYAQDKYLPVQTSQAVKAGANYVLEEIENVIKSDRILGHPFPSLEMRYNQIISVIEQLKK